MVQASQTNLGEYNYEYGSIKGFSFKNQFLAESAIRVTDISNGCHAFDGS